jgi:hypothetical protein
VQQLPNVYLFGTPQFLADRPFLAGLPFPRAGPRLAAGLASAIVSLAHSTEFASPGEFNAQRYVPRALPNPRICIVQFDPGHST